MATNEPHFAASSETLEEADKKIQEYDMDELDDRKRTAFLQAAYNGDVAEMKILKDRNASLTSVDNYGRSALHLAAKEDRLEAVEYLLCLDFDAEKRDDYGRQAHHLAALKGAMGTLRVLLGDPIVNIEPTMNEDMKMELLKRRLASVDNYGRTLLHLAAKEDFVEIVEYLINLGADVNVRDNHGRPNRVKGYLRQAHHLAAKNGALRTLRVLLDHPEVNINEVDGFDHTAYVLARFHNQTKAQDLLLEKGADPNAGSPAD